MNENKKQCCKKTTKNQENTKEVEKMKEVISVEACQNTELVNKNKEIQNKN